MAFTEGPLLCAQDPPSQSRNNSSPVNQVPYAQPETPVNPESAGLTISVHPASPRYDPVETLRVSSIEPPQLENTFQTSSSEGSAALPAPRYSLEHNSLSTEADIRSLQRRCRAFTSPRTLTVPNGSKRSTSSDAEESCRSTLPPTSETRSPSTSTCGDDVSFSQPCSSSHGAPFMSSRTRRGRSKTGPAVSNLHSLHLPSRSQSRSLLSLRGERVNESCSNTASDSTDGSKRVGFRDDGSARSQPPAHIRQRWMSVFERMFRDLAAQSSKHGRSLDKETFLVYFPLPGVLGERLFDLFDKDKSQSVDFREFSAGLAVIYTGTPSEKKKFLFDMYDLDNNGKISREEFSALLSHIPATFRILRRLGCPNDVSSPEDQSASEFNTLTRLDSLNSMERHINSLVDTIFENARATVTPQSCTSDVELQRKETADAELTFDEFCTALEKSKEICDVLNFFYNLGMPDVPIPLEALTKSSSRQTQRISNSPNALSECSSSFGHSSNPWEWFLFFTRQLCTFLKAWCGSLFSSGKTQFQLQDDIDSKDPEFSACGWLYRVRPFFNRKQYRYYVLRDNFLYCFADKYLGVMPEQVMFVRGARVSPVCVTDGRQSGFAFDIEFPQTYSKKVQRLYADSQHDREVWVAKISSATRCTKFHDEYTLQVPIARGKFAVVHQGISKIDQRAVAIKVIPKPSKDKPRRLRAFLRTEVGILRLLQPHRNIVRLLDVHESTEFVYVVMEWIPTGDVGSLAFQLLNHKTHPCYCLPEEKVLSQGNAITTQILAERLAWIVAQGTLSGLQCLHFRNIVHRDLKPENILLIINQEKLESVGLDVVNDIPETRQPLKPLTEVASCPCIVCPTCRALRSLTTVKISDFGLSTILQPRAQANEPLGTLCYAAPEVVRGRPYGRPVDLWALGVITYQLLSAYQSLPFDSSSEGRLARAIVAAQWGFEPESYWNGISNAAKDFTQTLLQRSPSSRPTAAEALKHPWFSHIPNGVDSSVNSS